MNKLDYGLIRQFWSEGMNDMDIAEKLNTHRETICVIRNKIGLKRQRKSFIIKELEINRIIFVKDYKNISHKLYFHGELNSISIRKIIIKRQKMPFDIGHIKKQIIYCKVGDEEYAFEQYMNRLSPRVKEYLKIIEQKTRSNRINRIRVYFGLKKLNGVKL